MDSEETFSAFMLVLGRTAPSAANDFVGNTLSLYNIKDKQSSLRNLEAGGAPSVAHIDFHVRETW